MFFKKRFVLAAILSAATLSAIAAMPTFAGSWQTGGDDVIDIPVVACEIVKTDETGAAVSGASLQLLKADGTKIKEWTTDGAVYSVSLEAGEYILREVSAPEGYEKAADLRFTITDADIQAAQGA